jgi:hypothetical protein
MPYQNMPDYQPLRRYEHFNVRTCQQPKMAQYTCFIALCTCKENHVSHSTTDGICPLVLNPQCDVSDNRNIDAVLAYVKIAVFRGIFVEGFTKNEFQDQV